MQIFTINEAQQNKIGNNNYAYLTTKQEEIIARINNCIRKESLKVKTHYSIECLSEVSHHLAYDIIQKYKEEGYNADWNFDSGCMDFIIFKIKW